MRIAFFSFVGLIAVSPFAAHSQKPRVAFPTEVVIGRDSFIDVGPPFDYYDLTFLRSKGDETDVERVSLTPPADSCYRHASIEVKHLTLKESILSLLLNTDPCSFSEKELKSELKRQKSRPAFSGMNVFLQTKCSGKTRIFRADILDRDIFGNRRSTPRLTSWTQNLFERLDRATGQEPWDKPLFSISGSTQLPASGESEVLQQIADGKYDRIFGDVPDRPSSLYRLAQTVPRMPTVNLGSIQPVQPVTYVEPNYPPIAKAARVEGKVDFHLIVARDGSAGDIVIDSGPKMLWQTVNEAIRKWKFSLNDAGKPIYGYLLFVMHCESTSK
ncbi:MAG: energy transducer TonB [Acidobacteriota bacterium]|nr:energy transducer TonB [Acidobacteriota bacterium]